MLNEMYRLATPWASATKMELLKNRILGRIANYAYPLYCKIVPISTEKDCREVIVSLTSYPGRMEKLHLCINSLLRQTVKPMRLILWLAESQFPQKTGVSKEILRLQKYGLEIRYCDDLKSYKKIFYAAQEFTDKLIVTADDDTLYPENWLENLLKVHGQYRNCVICYRAHEMIVMDGHPKVYREWKQLSPGIKGPSKELVPIGVGGVLYPEFFFNGVDFNFEIIRKLCPTADDLWLKAIAIRKNIPAVKVDANSKEWFTICNSQKSALMQSNVAQDRNDVALHNLITFFDLKF